ncbi:hypothetical protein ACN4EG_27395 [Alkalinema pantanalense CENA528]|uniref:hypothetical protein n=1 Tax=Alkalinema pantanalense TaxID=1620705 RepID=UPI003D6F09B6
MLTFLHTSNRSEQLTPIEETQTQLIFQKGEKTESPSWKSWLGLVISGLGLVVVLEHWLKGVFVLQAAFSISSAFLIATGLSIVIIVTYFNPLWVRWYFHRDKQQLTCVKRFLIGKSQKSFPFFKIREIMAQQYEAVDSQGVICAYVSMVLTSGKEIKLSQSPFLYDRREIALSLQYHRKIAEMMRDFLGQTTPAEQRAEAVKVPSLEAIQQERKAAWQELKGIFGAIFSGKQSKQAQIQALRQAIAQNPQNPKDWEQLALFLVLQKTTFTEGLQAYQRAELLYRHAGETEKADSITTLVQRYQNR